MYIYLLSMTPQHAAMEGTANWAQMTWTSFRLRYVFFLYLFFLSIFIYYRFIYNAAAHYDGKVLG